MDLSGARVLVTGGSRGIGREIARQLRERDAAVAICARGEERLRAVAGELGCLPITADVGRPDHAAMLVEEAIGGLGGLDVLINNAAVGSFALLLDGDAEDFQRILAVNVLGAYRVAQAAARHFVEQGSGHIVNVASTAARKGFEGGSAYAASKFALTGLTECWRGELRRHGVRVMQINPSEVQTGFGGREVPDVNPTKLVASDVAEAVVAMLALPDRVLVTETTLFATNPR
jgi:3-oxoacyl-[acyl-carrier protein] reductase